MKKYIRENTAAPSATPTAGASVPATTPAAPATEDKKLGSSAQKLQDRLAKISGLGKLMGGVNRGDAAKILAAIAEKLGGDKVEASAALTAALKIANTNKQAAAPANQQVTEQASRNVEAFVRYLFE